MVLVLLSIPTAIWFIIQNNQVQTWLVTKATQIIEEKIETKVTIEKVDYRPFNRLLLRNVFIADLKQDTLFAAETVSVNLMWFSSKKKIINLNRVTAESAQIYLNTDSLGVMNLSALLQSLRKDTIKEQGDPFSINIRHARLKSTTFAMKHENADSVESGINFQDLYITNANLDINYIEIAGDTISFTIAEMDFLEKSGFLVERFRTDVSFSSQHMNFEKLRLVAMGSNLSLPYLRMSYNDWEDMGNFIEEVRLNGVLDKSILNTNFLSSFSSGLDDIDLSLTIACTFRGTISDIRVRDMDVRTGNNTNLNANINITGLPDINNSLLIIDIKSFTTDLSDIETIKDHNTGQPLIDLPDNFLVFDNLSYTGNFTGFLSDFVAFGTLNSAIGSLSMDIAIKPNQQKSTNFSGEISAKGLDLGKLTDNQLLGRTSLKASIKGSTDYSNSIEALTDATIYSIEANEYEYTNIKISGNLTNKTYVGTIFLDDPNLKLNFMGKVDFSDTIPVFDFSAFVPKIDLVKLNLNKVDSISQASFLLTSKFSGSNLDNSQGEVKVLNCFYKNQNGEIKTSDITILANNSIDSKLISLKSEFAEGELRGKYNYANIFSSLSHLVYRYIPALSPDNKKPEILPSGVENPEYNDYIIKLRLRKTQKLFDVISPGFKIAENTNLFGIYNPDFQSLTLKVMIPELVVGGNLIKNISIDGQTYDTTFVASISTPSLEIGQTHIRNINVTTTTNENNIFTKLSWDNRTQIKNQGLINAITHFEYASKKADSWISFQFQPSQFFLNDTLWNINPSQIIIDSSHIAINNFALVNRGQNLKVRGNISSNPKDSVVVELNNIDISNINLYTKDLGYQFEGQIDGYAKVTNIIENPLFYSDLTLNDFYINKQEVGDFVFTSQWFADAKKLSINATNSLYNEFTFRAHGDIYPDSKNLNFKVNINHILLSHIEPILDGNLLDVEGSLSGNITVGGSFDKPIVNGILSMNNAGMTVDFSKTRYRISDVIYIDNSNIFFRGFKIQDVNNRTAILNGSIQTDYFKDINLDLNITPNNFQFLNTTERDNELFYGIVYATGLARVWGSPSSLNVDASVRTEPRTAIFLPLSSSSDVAESDFISFVNRSSDIIIIEDIIGIEETPKANLAINLNLEVTPEAEAQIIIDKQLGDIIKANGSGNLKMEVNPSKDIFNMFGEYIIEKGDYLFTLQGVINKRLRIGEGSTINWNGEVDDANMDIKAIYSLRTSLKPLFPAQQDEKFNKRLPVDCQIFLTGKLMEPTIEFNIDLPGADSETKAQVQSILNTEENMSMQFLSLLVINSFIDPSGGDNQAGGQFSQGLASTASEMLSNQLSNWLSQWSNTFDIGLNYRPGDPAAELSSNEVELAVSTQLFNDRVTINGNVDMGTQTSSSPIAGDFNIDVKIVPSGKIRLKAFARSNDDVLYGSTQSPFTTGAGVMYREDFNSLNELWRRYLNIFKPKPSQSQENDIPIPDYDSFFIPLDTLKKDENAFLGIK
jgi:hypothetical protein